MSINVSNLEKVILEKMNSASTEKELLEYSKIIEKLKTGTVQVVSTFGDLPFSSEHVGELYYVSDEKTVYWANEEYGWNNLYLQNIKEIYSWGWNQDGQLGDGTNISRSSPVQETGKITEWCQVDGGLRFSSGLKSSGELYSWGANLFGQVGNNTASINFSSPVQEVSSSTNWCQVSSGYVYSLALKTSGTLWGWGRNLSGELGDGTTVNKSSPVQEVSSSIDWSQVSSGDFHALALKTSGDLFLWGSNTCGQLGNQTVINSSSPVQEVSSSSDWCQVSGGGVHSLALKTSGTLWGWGYNLNGELGINNANANFSSPVQEITSSTNWSHVSGGGFHTLGLKTSGTLWSWGDNNCGKLGISSNIDASSPIQESCSSTEWCQISAGLCNNSLALKTSGTLWGWGSNNDGELAINFGGVPNARFNACQEFTSSTNWCQVSGGGSHTLAIKYIRNI